MTMGHEILSVREYLIKAVGMNPLEKKVGWHEGYLNDLIRQVASHEIVYNSYCQPARSATALMFDPLIICLGASISRTISSL